MLGHGDRIKYVYNYFEKILMYNSSQPDHHFEDNDGPKPLHNLKKHSQSKLDQYVNPGVSLDVCWWHSYTSIFTQDQNMYVLEPTENTAHSTMLGLGVQLNPSPKVSSTFLYCCYIHDKLLLHSL